MVYKVLGVGLSKLQVHRHGSDVTRGVDTQGSHRVQLLAARP
jgi:hypothetical protein